MSTHHETTESIPPVTEPQMPSAEPPPEPQGSFFSRLRGPKMIGIGAAVVASIVAIVMASRFSRPPPPENPPLPGIQIGDGNVVLAADAPAWRMLRVAEAKKADTHESDPFAARVKLDETRASKVGTPLPGRVTAVFVELGQKVKVGDPLFSVASPDIAGLRAERDKASVDVEVAKTALERVKAMVAARAVPAKDELYASQEYKEALVSMRLAQSKLSSLKVSSRKDNEFTLVSPRDGVVVQKDVLPSQEVSADATLLEVADLSKV